MLEDKNPIGMYCAMEKEAADANRRQIQIPKSEFEAHRIISSSQL